MRQSTRRVNSVGRHLATAPRLELANPALLKVGGIKYLIYRGERISRADISHNAQHAPAQHLSKMARESIEPVEVFFENGERAVISAAAAWALLIESALLM